MVSPSEEEESRREEEECVEEREGRVERDWDDEWWEEERDRAREEEASCELLSWVFLSLPSGREVGIRVREEIVLLV